MTSRLRRSLLCARVGLFVWAGIGAGAQAASAPVTPQDRAAPQISVRYAVYVHGFHALDATAAYRLLPWGYGATTHIRTVGLSSLFLSMRVTTTVQGRFTAQGTKPILYDSAGFSRGRQRHLRLTYDEAGLPDVTILDPPEKDREPVTAEQRARSLDILSGMGTLLHELSVNGRCAPKALIFDGLRLTAMTASGPVATTIPQDHGISTSGPALRCDFVGRQMAGFVKDTPNRAKLAAPQSGAAWFKSLDGFGLVPVRISFGHPKLGRILLVLQQPPKH